MHDVYVDIEDTDVSDDFIDVSEVVSSGRIYVESDNKVVKRYHHDSNNHVKRPSDYVDFRYGRYDRDKPLLLPRAHRNPVMVAFDKYQSAITKVANSDLSYAEKRKLVWALVDRFKQELRQSNIRYRNLWRNLNTHEITNLLKLVD